MKTPIPLKTDFSARRPAAQVLARACIATALTKTLDGALETAKAIWPDDHELATILTRADASPANITAGAWGSVFAGTAVGRFFSLLPGAGAKLHVAGTRLPLDGVQQIQIPKRTTAAPATPASWVGPGEPISVFQGGFEAAPLGPPKKLSTIIVGTSETWSYSGAGPIFAQIVTENINAGFDAALFSSSTGAYQPDGLLVGVDPIAASVAAAPYDRMIEDLANLAGAVTDAGGPGDSIVFVCSPRQAQFCRLNLKSNEQITVWSTPALSDGTVIAIETSAFVSGFGTVPRIALARDATLHMSSVAGALVPATSGVSVFADPTRSLFQSDCVAVRVTLPASWVMRAPWIATITSVNWGRMPGSEQSAIDRYAPSVVAT